MAQRRFDQRNPRSLVADRTDGVFSSLSTVAMFSTFSTMMGTSTFLPEPTTREQVYLRMEVERLRIELERAKQSSQERSTEPVTIPPPPLRRQRTFE